MPLCGMSTRSWDTSAIGHFRGTDQQGSDFDIVFGPVVESLSRSYIASGKTDDKYRALPGRALDFDCTAVQLNDLLTDGQAEP